MILEETALSILANYGGMGIMLAWFMFRTERVIKNNTDAMQKFSQKAAFCTYNNSVRR